jgi:hypothetical protein
MIDTLFEALWDSISHHEELIKAFVSYDEITELNIYCDNMFILQISFFNDTIRVQTIRDHEYMWWDRIFTDYNIYSETDIQALERYVPETIQNYMSNIRLIRN